MLVLKIDTEVLHDATKPIGDACNADGTLKDASEIDWLHSPSDENSSFSKRTRSEEFVNADRMNSKRVRVSKHFN